MARSYKFVHFNVCAPLVVRQNQRMSTITLRGDHFTPECSQSRLALHYLRVVAKADFSQKARIEPAAPLRGSRGVVVK